MYVVDDPHPVSVGGIFDNDGIGQIWGMWTEPAHRGRGHARRILDAVTPLLPRVQLHVNITNGDARTVYERYGFVGHRRDRAPPSGLGDADRADGAQPTRLTALITALSDAVTMFGSRPMPHTTSVSPDAPVTAHSTYAAAMASPPALSACSA